MCSIMGYCDVCADTEAFTRGFLQTVSRGPDDSRIVDVGRGLLGFHRLAIMGLTPEGMQPFELDGSYVVCNGELYGFQKLKDELTAKGYTFQSGSDCELLLPLWREHGVDMFRLLDAEFANSSPRATPSASGRSTTASTRRASSSSPARRKTSQDSAT